MPTKHVLKSYDAPAFYHIYNRASGERLLFKDDLDRHYFISLLQKYLSEVDDNDDTDTKKHDVEVVAYCLMGTHFHLLLFQESDVEAISGYMRSVGTAYSMFYNKKYKSKGHVFQSSYRASHIGDEAYLAHITRYIHLNPRRHASWQWSSYKDYTGQQKTEWVHPERLLKQSELGERYADYVTDYSSTDRRVQESQLKDYLAT